MAQVSWSDRKGHVGLKFIELCTIADEWKPWFAGADEAEAGAADADQNPTDAKVLPGLQETTAPAQQGAKESPAEDVSQSQASYDLRKDLTPVPCRPAWLEWTKRIFRSIALALLIAVVLGAGWYLYVERASYCSLAVSKVSALASAPEASGDPAIPSAQSSPQSKLPRLITRAQVVEGEPALESGRQTRKLGLIERGKAISRPGTDVGALAVGASSEVLLLLTIDQTGGVDEVKILLGDPKLAREAALAAGHWRYTPFTSNCSPVSVKLPVTIKFEKSPCRTARRTRSSQASFADCPLRPVLPRAEVGASRRY